MTQEQKCFLLLLLLRHLMSQYVRSLELNEEKTNRVPLMVGLKEVISFQNRGHQHRVVDSLGENMEAGKEHPRGKEKGALQRRPVGCQTARFLTLHNTCWACLGLERPTGRAGLSPMACWSLISLDPILHQALSKHLLLTRLIFSKGYIEMYS